MSQCPRVLKIWITYIQGGRTWQPFVEGKNGHENFRQARMYNFRDKCDVFAGNCKFAITRKNGAFDAKIVNTRLAKIFIAIFAPDERLPSSATLGANLGDEAI